MAYNRSHARRLLNEGEMALFSASLSDQIGSYSPAELSKKRERARKLRDKHTDLFRRQSLETRDRTGTKRGRSGVANERTAQKATLMGEALARFEAQIDRADRAAARESKRAALERARKAKGGGGRTTPKKAGSSTTRTTSPKAVVEGPKDFMSERASAARNSAKITSPRNQKITAHVGAQGRRNQAKRDAR